MAAVVKDPAPRLVSPLLFILAGLCFLLPFAGVSCNTTAVKPEIASLSELGGATSAAEQRAENACLDGLNGFDLWTYTGLNLAAGSDPKVAASEPAACNNLSAAAGGTVSTTPSRASDVNVGVQPLILVAVAAMVLGLLLSLFRYAIRGLVVAVLAIGAIALLFLASTNLGLRGDDQDPGQHRRLGCGLGGRGDHLRSRPLQLLHGEHGDRPHPGHGRPGRGRSVQPRGPDREPRGRRIAGGPGPGHRRRLAGARSGSTAMGGASTGGLPGPHHPPWPPPADYPPPPPPPPPRP